VYCSDVRVCAVMAVRVCAMEVLCSDGSIVL
jgi:hypothetical protein